MGLVIHVCDVLLCDVEARDVVCVWDSGGGAGPSFREHRLCAPPPDSLVSARDTEHAHIHVNNYT